MNKLKIVSKNDQSISGTNVEVYLDGKKLTGVTKLSLDIKADGLTKTTLELIGPVDVDVASEVEIKGEKK